MIVDLEEERRSPFRPSWRVMALLVAIMLSFGALLAGAVARNLYQQSFLNEESNKRYIRSIRLHGERGVIWDSTGRPLAASAPISSVYANPRHFREWAEGRPAERVEAEIDRIAGELGADRGEIAKQLGLDKAFVYLKHYLSPEEAKEIKELGLKGIYIEPKFRRFYPSDYLAAQLVGFTDYKNEGTEGIERSRDKVLRQASGQRKVLRTTRDEILEEYAVSPPIDGNDIHLTIDLRLQFLAYLGLERTVREHKAKSATVVLVDARDGSILAMASYPTFNPNTRAGDAASRRNRAIQDVFEPGSTVKPLVAAMALDAGMIGPEAILPTSKPLRYGKYVIRDEKIKEDLSVSDVIMRSSNVGAVSMAEMLPSDHFWDMLHNRLGFGKPVGIDFPSAASGIVRHYDDWYPVDKATLAYGYGMSISLLHLARAYAAFANDGFMPQLRLIRGEPVAAGRKVFGREAVRAVMPMMESVVSDEGTAPKAAVPGYRIAGKTGTGHKNRGGAYQDDAYQAKFVGLGPVSDPRFVAAVFVDEPTRGGYYGGTVAAPLFSYMMEHAFRLYGVDADAPEAPPEEVALAGE